MISEKEFTRRLMATYEDLRKYALSLTQNEDDADDLVHSVVLKAIEKRATYDSKRSLRTWIVVVLRNHYIDEWRLRRKLETVHFDSFDSKKQIASTPCSQEHYLMFRDLLTSIRTLSRPVIEVLLMSGLEGLTHEQISKKTGLALGTVKCRIRRGKKALEHHRAGYTES